MALSTIIEIFKYFDFFGTTFNFYTERKRKLYTLFGGILTLFAIIFGLIVFFYINLDDFLQNIPNSTTSTKIESYRKIKFRDEKIWIPWRIRDFGGKTKNHSNILYPLIYYYKGVRNSSLEGLNVSYEFVGYKLCNETSMINNSDIFMLDIKLEQLYCIDMEDIDIGGSWDTDFLDLITFDLYTCKNGIDYNESNQNCTTYEEISKFAGNNDCLEFEMYYTVVQYQPMNKTNPILVRYYNYFYHLSRYSNKIDRLYLQQHLLKDEKGIALRDEKLNSYWGSVSLNGDSYATGDKRDLMNEGSTSRLYSFNIYLKSDVVYYNRSYKKIGLILANGLPIFNVIFGFFRILAKVFKISSGNKKLTELLFENLKKKKINIKNNQLSHLKYESKKKLSKIIQNNSSIRINNNTNDISTFQLNQKESRKKILSRASERKNSLGNLEYKPKIGLNSNNLFNHNKNGLTKSSKKNNNDIKEDEKRAFNNIKMNINSQIHHLKEIFSIKSDDISSNLHLSNKINKKKEMENDKKNKVNSVWQNKSQDGYIKKTLFPFRYYLCSIFIKNIDVSKNSIFFTKKFVVVYNFICQLFDISSYLILQKEFEIMKNSILLEKYRDILENRQKINVNDVYFNLKMKECLDTKKFSILGNLK